MLVIHDPHQALSTRPDLCTRQVYVVGATNRLDAIDESPERKMGYNVLGTLQEEGDRC